MIYNYWPLLRALRYWFTSALSRCIYTFFVKPIVTYIYILCTCTPSNLLTKYARLMQPGWMHLFAFELISHAERIFSSSLRSIVNVHCLMLGLMGVDKLLMTIGIHRYIYSIHRWRATSRPIKVVAQRGTTARGMLICQLQCACLCRHCIICICIMYARKKKGKRNAYRYDKSMIHCGEKFDANARWRLAIYQRARRGGVAWPYLYTRWWWERRLFGFYMREIIWAYNVCVCVRRGLRA